MTDEKTPDEWAAEYGAIRPAYEAYAQRLEGLIRDLLKAERIDFIQVESRAKTVASFVEKMRRKDRHDKEPFESIMDLVGLRIITYYLDDVDRAGRLLESEFEIDPENSTDKAQILASDQFGYRSVHYIARLTPARSKLVEWRSYSEMPVEFQVRTSLQHAWAAVSHKLDYKSVQEGPAPMRRKLFRLSALFELADEEFAALRDQREATLTAYREDVKQGRLEDVPIDTSSLAAYWNVSDTAAKFRQQLTNHGFTGDDMWEIDQNRLNQDRTDLVRVLRECNLLTLTDLDHYLLSDRPEVIMKEVVNYNANFEYSDERYIDSNSYDFLTLILLIDYNKVDAVDPPIYLDPTQSSVRSIAEGLR